MISVDFVPAGAVRSQSVLTCIFVLKMISHSSPILGQLIMSDFVSNLSGDRDPQGSVYLISMQCFIS